MSTIPGGCFVAPDSLRRLNQLHKQQAREAKMQQTVQASGAAPDSPVGSPCVPHRVMTPADQGKPSTFTHMITTAPFRLSEIFGRARSMSTPPPAQQPTPPVSPPLSPMLSRSPPRDPIPIPIPQHQDNDASDQRSHAQSV